MNILKKDRHGEVGVTDKRAAERFESEIDARFFYGNLFYSGTVMNISEKGMFINTKRCLPDETMFIVLIRAGSDLVKVIARVKRSDKNNLDCDGMGVEIISPPLNYTEYVSRLIEIP